LIAAYPFYLAIENSISLDYVSEKVYEPLLVGTIPIYLGAPNIEDFLPTAHSAILATDFASIKELAAYVLCVLRTPSVYDYYVNWKSRPLLPSFEALHQRFAPLCHACVEIALAIAKTKSSVASEDASSRRQTPLQDDADELARMQRLQEYFDADAWRAGREPGFGPNWGSSVHLSSRGAQKPLDVCLGR
jgi:hypothetical protein